MIAGSPLSLQHREAQIVIARHSTRQLLAIWPGFNPARIDESWSRMEAPTMLIVESNRVKSAGLAQEYYKALRAREGVRTALPRVALPLAEWDAAARVSLNVTGPIMAKAAIAAKRPLQDVAANTLVRLTGSVSRLALEGGRTTIDRYLRVERVRYRRVTSGSPCPFCSMLASRGAAYLSSDTGGFEAHDHCSCMAEPVFR